MQVFEKLSQDDDDYILLYDMQAGNFHTINFTELKAHSKNRNIDDGVSVVQFTKSSVTLSNNETFQLDTTAYNSVAAFVPELLIQLPKLMSKCERQEELLLDYKQRLGISDPSSPDRKKKTTNVKRDLLNPRIKKPTTGAKRGFVEEE